ncbi:MAG: DUF4270 family protein [Saprospiraceae bacterium]|nr:DUF4270 family protein [Saprospiraceae bacterium]
MSILSKGKYWLFALGSMILLYGSCNEFDSFGSDILDTGWLEAKGDEIYDFSIGPAEPDSIVSFAELTTLGAAGFLNAAFPLGSMNDPVFGQSSAGLGTQLRFIPTNNLDFLHNAIDSIVLSLRFDTSLFYGSYVDPMNISVYRLSEAYDPLKTYYSTYTLPVDQNTKLGEVRNYEVNKNDSITIREDTLDKVLFPQLRISIDTAKFMGILRTYPDTVYFVSDSFTKLFLGLAVICENGNGYLSILPEHGDSKLTIYYKDTTQRQSRVELFMSNLAVKTPYYQRDPGSTVVNQFYNGTISGDSLLFIQGAGGRDLRLRMPYQNKWNGKFINYAVLNFEVAVLPGDNLDLYKLPGLLQIFDISSGSRVAIDDVILGTASQTTYRRVFGGYPIVDSTGNQIVYRYKMNLTRHFQKALRKNADLDLVISPFAKLESPARLVWNGRNLRPSGARLELTYSE